jgi:LPS-assembly lipoprotein
LSRAASLALLLALAGCGFQLQGALTVPPEMERTYISAEDRHSGFYRDLRAAFKAAGVDLVDSPNEATATFTIAFDNTDQRVLSVSARNVPTEYEVYYTVEYWLYSGEKKLLDAQTLTLTRDYTYDSTLVLGKSREEELIREAIVDDLVRIVLKQISAL